MAFGFGAFAIGSIISALVGSIASIAGNAMNVQSQKETNEANKEMTEATNATNLQIAQENNALQADLAKNAHQYEMEDLKAAGLNPVMTANGGTGASIGALSTAHMNAPRNVAPMVDFNGVASALNAMNSMMMTQAILGNRTQLSNDRNDVLRGLYNRKAAFFSNSGQHSVSSANQVNKVMSVKENIELTQQWKKMLEELNKIK